MQSNGNTAEENVWTDQCRRTDTRLTKSFEQLAKIFERIRSKGWTAGCVMCWVFLEQIHRISEVRIQCIFFCGHRSHLRACEWKWWIKIILRFPQSINLKWCSLWIFSSLAWFYLESLFKFGDANLCRPVFNFSHGKLILVRITYCI